MEGGEQHLGLSSEACLALRRAAQAGMSGLPRALRAAPQVLAAALAALHRMADDDDDDTPALDQEALMDLELLRAAVDAVQHLGMDFSPRDAPSEVDLSLLGSRSGGLKSLELRGVSLSCLSGLPTVRRRLECLLISGCPDLCSGTSLASLPGDGASSRPVVWDRLERLSLRRCRLARLDPAVLFAVPNLVLLDLSSNLLEEISGGLSDLVSLRSLDLSFNRLRLLPALPASSSLRVLRVSCNRLSSLGDGVTASSCSGLVELDVSFNLLQGHRVLAPVSLLSRLRRLRTEGNPMAGRKQTHRRRTLAWVSRDVDPTLFSLDGRRLSGPELEMTGLAMVLQSPELMQEIPDVVPRAADHHHYQLQQEQQQQQQQQQQLEVALPADLVPPEATLVEEEEEGSVSVVSSVSGKKRRRRRRRRPREATIGETETTAETNEEERARMLARPRAEDELSRGDDRGHLEVKRRIEDLRATFGQDDWLQGRAGEKVHQVLGIQKDDERSFSQVIAQRLSEAKSKEESIAKFVREASLQQQRQESSKGQGQASKEEPKESIGVLDQKAARGHSDVEAESGGEAGGSFYNEVYEKGGGEEEHADDAMLLQVCVKRAEGGGEEREEPLVLKIDGNYVQELAPSGRVMEQWFLHCLEVCEVGSRGADGKVSLSLEFNSTRSRGARYTRLYFADEETAEKLQEVARPILEALARHALRLGALQCVKCQTEFTHDGYVGDGAHSCPNCKSSMVIALETTPMPVAKRLSPPSETAKEDTAALSGSLGEEAFRINVKDCSTPQKETTARNSKEPTSAKRRLFGMDKPSLIYRHRRQHSLKANECREGEESLSRSGPSSSTITPPPESSASSAAAHHRSESSSDISVLSNPSQSSIEVLPRKTSPPKKAGEETEQEGCDKLNENATMSTTTDTLKAEEVPTNVEVAQQQQLTKKMLESSSSGSMADSVVTTQEVPPDNRLNTETGEGGAATTTTTAEQGQEEEEEEEESEKSESVEIAEDVLSSMEYEPGVGAPGVLAGNNRLRQQLFFPHQKSGSNGNVSTDDTESYRTAMSDLSLNLVTANTTFASNTPVAGNTPSGDNGEDDEDADASTPKAQPHQGARMMLPPGLRQMSGPMSLFSAISRSSSFSMSIQAVAEGEKLPEDADDGLALEPSVMEWDFADFSNADHRLKLYCELSLCDEPDECVLLMAKGRVVVRSTGRGFLAVVVVSNKRLHLLRVTKAETEEPEEWLCRLEAHCHRVSSIVRLHRLLGGQGVGVEFASSSSSETLLLVLGDRDRCEAFSAQLTQSLLENVSAGAPVQSVDRTEEKSQKLARHLQQQEARGGAPKVLMPYERIDHFAVAYLLAKDRLPSRVSVVLTQATCVMTSDFFQWDAASSKAAAKPLDVKKAFMIREVTQIDVFDQSPCRLRLTLNGEVESAVGLVFDTEATLLGAMLALRSVWEKHRKMDIEEIVVFNLEKEGQTLRLHQVRLEDSASFGFTEWIHVIKRSLSPTHS